MMEGVGWETDHRMALKDHPKYLLQYRKPLPNTKNLTIKDTYFSYLSFIFAEKVKILSLLLKMTME